MYDSIKNKAGNFWRKTVTSMSKSLTESKFYEKGILTPGEYEEAGDKLCFVCPSWTWKSASDKKLIFKDLPEKKQYLSTRVMSSERIKEVFDQIESAKPNAEGWIVTSIKEEHKSKYETEKKKLDDETEPKEDEFEFGDLDDFSEEEETPEIAKPVEKPAQEEMVEGGKESSVRYYDITITYDRYYHTPRLWLSGIKENGQPLTNEEIFEDIMSEYINKTVTIEAHPHIGTNQASIHPCKHAEVIHTLVSEARSNGNEITSAEALFIFLKFMNSVMPTLEFDHTTEITLNN